jgi:hypothetical protein
MGRIRKLLSRIRHEEPEGLDNDALATIGATLSLNLIDAIINVPIMCNGRPEQRKGATKAVLKDYKDILNIARACGVPVDGEEL